jgi:pseudouridine synthase
MLGVSQTTFSSVLCITGLSINGIHRFRRFQPPPQPFNHPPPAVASIGIVAQQRYSRASRPSSRDRKQSGNPPSNLQRLNKALASTGVASRRGADDLIFAGRIAVNGAIVTEPGTRINLFKDKLELDGRAISTAAAAKKYYFALNKPKGYICTSVGDGSGGSGDRLVVDIFADWKKEWKTRHPGSGAPPRLFTVGRLDVASVGLIFVTNDGDWAQAVQHPSSGITKEYSVTLNRRPGKADLEALARGCEMDGAMVAPVAVATDDTDLSKPNRIRIILAEGRNREVRQLVEAAGMEVRVLRRVRIGGYRLPRGLGFGEFVELRPHELRRVLNIGADRTI